MERRKISKLFIMYKKDANGTRRANHILPDYIWVDLENQFD